MTRKGQAAIEFLSTYGLAMISMLAVVGALFYFGIFNPATLRNSFCDFPNGFFCDENALQNANPPALATWAGRSPAGVSLPNGLNPYAIASLINTYGVNLSVDNVTMKLDDSSIAYTQCAVVATVGTVDPWPSGGNRTVYCAMPSGSYVKGQRYEGVVTVLFRQSPLGAYQHNISGRFSIVAN